MTAEMRQGYHNMFRQKTPGGYDFGEVVSALQKTIRAGDSRPALYWAAEMEATGSKEAKYLWNRLNVIASEDIGPTPEGNQITILLPVLHRNYESAKVAGMTLTCRKCGIDKPDSDFPLTRTGNLSSVCADCKRERKREALQRWRKANLDKIREYNRRQYATNPELYRERARQWARDNPDKVREKARRLYAANPEPYRERARQYALANPGKIRERARQYSRRARLENPELRRAATRRYRESHVEQIKAYRKLAHAANPAKSREYFHRRRARKATGTVGKVRSLATMIASQRRKCYLCGRRFTQSDPAVIEHVIPLAKGGQHSDGNTAAAHRSCNSRKGAILPADYAARIGRLLI